MDIQEWLLSSVKSIWWTNKISLSTKNITFRVYIVSKTTLLSLIKRFILAPRKWRLISIQGQKKISFYDIDGVTFLKDYDYPNA